MEAIGQLAEFMSDKRSNDIGQIVTRAGQGLNSVSGIGWARALAVTSATATIINTRLDFIPPLKTPTVV